MQAVEAGALVARRPRRGHLAAWRGADREAVTIADLLEHASGLTAYLPFFRDHQRTRASSSAPSARCRSNTRRATQAIYSDLGFILLGFILEDVDLAGLREAVHARPATEAAQPAAVQTPWLPASAGHDLFNPPRAGKLRATTELDIWRGRLLQGEVHDENAWALGGVAGHAGMFGTGAAVGSFARDVLKGLAGARRSRGRRRSRASRESRRCLAARARSAGTRCCRRRRAARACRRARSVTPDSRGRRCGSIRSWISTSCS